MDYLYLILRVILLYFLMIVILKLLGKRELGKLSIFDLVILLVIADVASFSIDDGAKLLYSIISLIILAILQKILSITLLHKAFLRNILDQSPKILVKDGKIIYKSFKKELYTIDDLISQMRILHIMDISEIKLAILESSGSLSVFKKDDNDIILPIILSGRYNMEALEILKLNKILIDNTLKQNKLSLNKVLYASIKNNIINLYYKDKKKEDILSPLQIKL